MSLQTKIYNCKLNETYPSILNQSLNDSFFDPSFFRRTIKINEIFFPPHNPINLETNLMYQNKPDQNNVKNGKMKIHVL